MLGYQCVTEKLKQRFEPAECENTYKVQFRSQTRKGEEDPDEYVEALTGLAHRAFPTFQAEATSCLIMDRFKEGQTNIELRTYLSLSPASSLHRLVGECVKLEAVAKRSEIRRAGS